MDVSDAVVLVELGAIIGGLVVRHYQPRVVEQPASEVEALRACLRISLAAWQARQELEQAAQLSSSVREVLR